MQEYSLPRKGLGALGSNVRMEFDPVGTTETVTMCMNQGWLGNSKTGTTGS